MPKVQRFKIGVPGPAGQLDETVLENAVRPMVVSELAADPTPANAAAAAVDTEIASRELVEQAGLEASISVKMDATLTPTLLLRPEGSQDRRGVLTPAIVGTVTTVAGQYGQAWNLSSGSLTFPVARHVAADQGTLLMRITGYDTTTQAVLYDATAGTNYHRIIVNADQGIFLRFGEGATSLWSGHLLPTTGSHVLAVTWGPNGVRAYLNGTSGSLLAQTPGGTLATDAWISGVISAGTLRYLSPVESVLLDEVEYDAAEITRLSGLTRAWTWDDAVRPSPEALAINEIVSPFAGGVNVTTINEQIDVTAASGGGTVRLPQGETVAVDGTIFLKSGVTLDLNGASLRAVNNAAFTDHPMGMDSLITTQAYNPASVKPIVAITGTEASRVVGASVINGHIDGNGINQPDSGSYANVLVDYADDCRVDVDSYDARPGITYLDGATNTGRRAFCLLIARAARTHVRGTYRNAGYDTIGLRQGAEDTILDAVYATKAPKGAIQIATGALRTKIIGGVYDNTEGGGTSSHAIFLHSAVWVDVIGATMLANTGSCFVAFGESSAFGDSREVTVASCAMEHTGTSDMVSLPTQYTSKIAIKNITFRKTGAGALFIAQGASSRVYLDGWVGASTGTSTAFPITGLTDFSLTNMDIETAAAGNQMLNLNGASKGRISGKFKQASGVGIITVNCADITLAAAKITASDSIQALGGNTNIDVLDCDLTTVVNANKLRIYGPDSGLVRGNRGAVTEGNGTATVPAASTSVTITHGLWQGTGTTATPRTDRLWSARDFQVSFAGNPGSASKVWVSSVTPTQVTFTVDAAPGANAVLAWSASMNRRT